MAVVQKAHGSGFGVTPNGLYDVLVDLQKDLKNAQTDLAAIKTAAATSLATVAAVTLTTATLNTTVKAE